MTQPRASNYSRSSLATAALAALVVSGCATELTFRRRAALDYFVGKDRSVVVDRLGQPTRISERNGSELLAYDTHASQWNPGQPGVRNGEGFPLGPWVDDSHCVTTFRIASGRVDAWSLNGHGCRIVEFPPLGSNSADALAAASVEGVDKVAAYQHDPFTGRSMVSYGEFHSN